MIKKIRLFFITLSGFLASSLLVGFIVSCTPNNTNISKNLSTFNHGLGGTKIVLSKSKYNSTYDEIPENKIALVVISNKNIYKDFVFSNKLMTLKQLMDKSKFQFKYHHSPGIGSFILTFKPNKNDNKWQYGIGKDLNYGDHYPFIFINHQFSQFGASNFKPENKDIIEITYDYY